MQDKLGTTLAVGDDVVIVTRGYLKRGRVVKINKATARVIYTYGTVNGVGYTQETSVYPQYIAKLIEGNHTPEVPVASGSNPLSNFVYNPDDVGDED